MSARPQKNEEAPSREGASKKEKRMSLGRSLEDVDISTLSTENGPSRPDSAASEPIMGWDPRKADKVGEKEEEGSAVNKYAFVSPISTIDPDFGKQIAACVNAIGGTVQKFIIEYLPGFVAVSVLVLRDLGFGAGPRVIDYPVTKFKHSERAPVNENDDPAFKEVQEFVRKTFNVDLERQQPKGAAGATGARTSAHSSGPLVFGSFGGSYRGSFGSQQSPFSASPYSGSFGFQRSPYTESFASASPTDLPGRASGRASALSFPSTLSPTESRPSGDSGPTPSVVSEESKASKKKKKHSRKKKSKEGGEEDISESIAEEVDGLDLHARLLAARKKIIDSAFDPEEVREATSGVTEETLTGWKAETSKKPAPPIKAFATATPSKGKAPVILNPVTPSSVKGKGKAIAARDDQFATFHRHLAETTEKFSSVLDHRRFTDSPESDTHSDKNKDPGAAFLLDPLPEVPGLPPASDDETTEQSANEATASSSAPLSGQGAHPAPREQ